LLKLFSQNVDFVLGYLGNKVDYPENKADGGNDSKNTYYESSGVLGFEITNYTVYSSNDSAENKLNNNLGDLRKLLVFGRVCVIICHAYVPPDRFGFFIPN